MRRLTSIILLAIFTLGTAPMTQAAAPNDFSLETTMEAVRKRYPDVPQLSTQDLASMSRDDLILLDTRSQHEFDVSHLEGALRLSPRSRSRDVMEAVGNVDGKTVVFYCSVGERSSRIANRSLDVLKEAGATAVYNLEGGLFRWHNEGREVVREGEPTRDIHPFNDKWGQLLSDRATMTKTPSE